MLLAPWRRPPSRQELAKLQLRLAPFRVPIPSEKEVWTTRQLPINTDPRLQREYRAIVEPNFFSALSTARVQGRAIRWRSHAAGS